MSLRSRARRDKRFAQALHAKRRAAQRYDFWASDADLAAIALQIERHHCRVLFQESRRVRVCEVEYAQRIFRVAYDGMRHQIITFLPREPHAAFAS